ncbi:hypothetical protein [Paracoccus onubensis]|uniref:hypothetical protein n=1 Tax=Paracoccus onubensis TaxID=1675788 RepID=UPI001E4D03D5|nr:hypothetical protein [Paracoccus onubensis]
MKENAAFGRWDEVEFSYGRPRSDIRSESCHVAEETIKKTGRQLKKREREGVLNPLVASSALHLANQGKSLGIIRPQNTKFYWKKKSSTEIEGEREAYIKAARQISMFDEALDALEPTPYHFQFSFEDGNGKHRYSCADWEAHATFFRHRKLTSETQALDFLSGKFNDEYPRKGMMFALGNMAKRPQTWQLLGVLRVDYPLQDGLF